jgi:hypothetical protein
LSEAEIKEKVLQSMIESGATPQAIAKVMVQQEILNAIGKSPDDMAKVLLKQLRSGNEVCLENIDKLLKSGGISMEDAGSIILVQKCLSVFNDVDPTEIARAALLQKGSIQILIYNFKFITISDLFQLPINFYFMKRFIRNKRLPLSRTVHRIP